MSTSKKIVNRQRRKVRIRSRVSGTADCPRLVVFRSNKHISAQLIDDVSRKTLASASDLKNPKGTMMERASIVGKTIAEAAKVKACVFDRNGYRYHGCVKAVADAAREAGLKF